MDKDLIKRIETILECIVPELLTDPSSFKIQSSGGTTSINFIISCDQNEISKIIGRNGRNIDALRQLIGAIGSKNGCRINILVNE